MTSTGLPDGIAEWVASVGGGAVTRLERHVARREAWVVDVTRADGSVLEGFLRLEREPIDADPWSLGKETRIVEALASTPVPVPMVHGRSERPSATLFARAPGRSDLPAVGSGQQRAVMEHFIDIVADLHRIDIASLHLDDLARPTTPAECALGELDLILDRWSGFLASYHDPLITFGVRWLRRHVPAQVSRVCLVQGDTGPVNFLFDGDRVSAVIDWEWGHFGDPMEDLGNICVREFWNPSGGLDGLFRRYEAASGIPYDADAVRYYRVQQNVRGMIPIHAITRHAHPQEPVAWYLAYRYVGDRATCEALAEAAGIEVDAPELPAEEDGDDVLVEAARFAISHDIASALDQPFASSRLHDVDILLQCMDRRRRYQPALAARDLDDLEQLLGAPPSTPASGAAALDEAILADRVGDHEVIRYLCRRALRDEWLWAPAVSLYPDRRWSAID